MNYIEFRNKFYELGCFYVHQIYAWYPKFDKSNLTRWVKKGLLIKLKNGYYSFPEYLHYPDFSFFVSNKIYRPSYISLHSALAFYGIIPEAVSRTTAVSAMKKMTFENRFGVFTYQQIAPHLMFGYDIKPFSNEQTILFAQPEKALLDLLYLYPFYNTLQEMEELRLDEDFLHKDFNLEKFNEYAALFQSNALKNRSLLLLQTYNLISTS